MDARSQINEANRLMSIGEKREAASLLMALLNQPPLKKSTCSDAISILVMGGLYKEARAVFELYKQNTGQELTFTDFSLADINEMQKQATATTIPNGQFKAFPFVAWRQGMLVFNTQRLLRGIEEVDIEPDRLVIKKRGKVFTYAWNQITEATLKSRYANVHGFQGWINHVSLRAPDQTFKLKLIANIPNNFERESDILPMLREHLTFS